MSYSFDTDLSTKYFTIKIDSKEEYGYFEHVALGEDCGGGLLFDGKELTDYDGVFALPKQVTDTLREAGYIVDEVFE